jgi:hypothetical protein
MLWFVSLYYVMTSNAGGAEQAIFDPFKVSVLCVFVVWRQMSRASHVGRATDAAATLDFRRLSSMRICAHMLARCATCMIVTLLSRRCWR